MLAFVLILAFAQVAFCTVCDLSGVYQPGQVKICPTVNTVAVALNVQGSANSTFVLASEQLLLVHSSSVFANPGYSTTQFNATDFIFFINRNATVTVQGNATYDGSLSSAVSCSFGPVVVSAGGTQQLCTTSSTATSFGSVVDVTVSDKSVASTAYLECYDSTLASWQAYCTLTQTTLLTCAKSSANWSTCRVRNAGSTAVTVSGGLFGASTATATPTPTPTKSAGYRPLPTTTIIGIVAGLLIAVIA
jgi:hypothetical protein